MALASSRTTADRESVESAPRFKFGRNWSHFLATVDESRIDAATTALQALLNHRRLTGCRFLDAGSGSGLVSHAAHQLGAEVTSFDFDAESVACTNELRKRFAGDAANWNVLRGSLLDNSFLSSLGSFDVVYCWGVAHHTGQMWTAIDHLTGMVAPHGQLVLAIYNDEGFVSQGWRIIKQMHQRLPAILRPLLVGTVGLSGFLRRALVTLAACLFRLITLRNPLTPISNWRRETRGRGMHGWYDLVDWVGGWPFEVAKPEEVFRFCRDRGFELQELTTSGGHGCNEFVFSRKAASPERDSLEDREEVKGTASDHE